MRAIISSSRAVFCAVMLALSHGCSADSRPAHAANAARGARQSGTGGKGTAGDDRAAAGNASSQAGAGTQAAGGQGAAGTTAACDLDPMPASGALAIDVAGVTRNYTLVLPDAYDGHTRFPVLFAWHGTGSNGAQFIGSYYGGITDGAAGRVLIVAPDGLVETQGEYKGMTRWQLSDVDGALFDTLLAELGSHYCIDNRRIFSTGHSIGAYFTNYLGCTRGNRLRSIAPISGGGPLDASVCLGRPAVVIGHNPHECTETGPDCPWAVPWSTTGWPSTWFWAARNGCADPSPMPTDAFTGTPPCQALAGCNSHAPVTLCLYDYSDQYSGPHAWPVAWLAGYLVDQFLGLPVP